MVAAPRLLDGYYADPNLVEFDGTFYLYPTTDGLEDWAATSFKAFSSTNLVDWIDHGVIFSVKHDTRWAAGHAWAPTMTRRDGQYFFYFTADDNIGVASSDSPVGRFIDLGRPLIRDGEFSGRAIDPSIFVDDDGAQYLLWGNEVAHAVLLAPDMISFEPSEVESWNLPGFREAPWMHRRGGTYYLSWSENDTREEDYRVRYATGTTPYGPWTDRGELLSKKPERGIFATGHHSILRVPGIDEWLIAYHRFSIPEGTGHHREIVLDRLHHAPEGGLLRSVEPANHNIHIDQFGPQHPN